MGSMLTTFVKPRPNATLIRCLEPINRWLNLRGIPVLRDIPLINRIPGMRGLTNITKIDFPEPDLAQLLDVVNPETAAFMAPNHPEFFTDWMVDKEVMAKLNVKPACWATHSVVNGMGKWAQKFWLANNLIAQIPGEGGTAGKQYSIELAQRGDGVLLHPEGAVHWAADQIGPLFPGVLEMAQRAAKGLAESRSDRPVYIVPLIYKYMFLRDETANLHRAFSYVEKSLDLPLQQTDSSLERRLRTLYVNLTNRVAQHHDITLPDAEFWSMRAALIAELTTRLASSTDYDKSLDDDPYNAAEMCLRHYNSARRSEGGQKLSKTVIQLANDLRELLNLQPWMYPNDMMTQEHIAERIQRIRIDWLKRRFRDRVHALVPQPVGPRCAHIRLADPLRINANTDVPKMDLLRSNMQSRLDDLNKELTPFQAGKLLPNAFLERIHFPAQAPEANM